MVRTRKSVCAFALKRKGISVNQKVPRGGEQDQRLERIRGKVNQMRGDWGNRFCERDLDAKERLGGDLKHADPPDKGGGMRPSLGDLYVQSEPRNQRVSMPVDGLPEEKLDPGCIKNQREGRGEPQVSPLPSTIVEPPVMASQANDKNKGPMSQSEEVASNGKLGRGTRPLEQGGPFHGRGDPHRTPVWQGELAPQAARYGGSGEAVAPVFPISMEVQVPNVVTLNMSRERAAMRSWWLTIILFFSMQLFSVGGHF